MSCLEEESEHPIQANPMTERQSKHLDILAAKNAYACGENVMARLRGQKNAVSNTAEIIEAAYDLQAGTYIKRVRKNPEQAGRYAAELADILSAHLSPADSMLDVGTGELTTLSLVTKALARKPGAIYAFDISWSRLFVGAAFAREHLGSDYGRLTSFAADMGEIPLLDKSVNITTSSHALEPNGGRLKELMSELFRITIDKLVLFEPCFESNSEEGRQRMERLGYIKNVDGVVEELGGKLVEKIMIKNTVNPLNPTVGFVISPPPPPQGQPDRAAGAGREGVFSVPGTNYPLAKDEGFYFSNDTGLCYPIIKSIPVLRSNAAVLASALCR